MNFKFQYLTLNCHQGTVTVPFSEQITYIHGQISTGKSTIARLIDFCLGADLVKTTAVNQELDSVQLNNPHTFPNRGIC